jgi:type 1 glutamine amidotransferase
VMKKGTGMVCVHYGVEVPKEKGGKEFLDWIGGYFEMHWSVNPHWEADFKVIPKHPITSGVKPFKINDEWYYHMRFPENMKGVAPILTAIPPESTLSRPDGPHSGNPAVRATKGQPQHVAWAFERPDGGRGFGFTGAHYHKNWGNESFRKVVLNALLWTAKADVPADGVNCAVSEEDLKQNLDDKRKR